MKIIQNKYTIIINNTEREIFAIFQKDNEIVILTDAKYGWKYFELKHEWLTNAGLENPLIINEPKIGTLVCWHYLTEKEKENLYLLIQYHNDYIKTNYENNKK